MAAVAIGMLAFAWIAPRLVAGHIAAVIGRRTGCSAELSSVGLEPTALSLRGLSVRCAFGTFEPTLVRIVGAPTRLAGGGPADRIEIVGGSATVVALPRHAADEAVEGIQGTRTSVRLDVRDLDVLIGDEAVELVRARLDASFDGREATVTVSNVRTGEDLDPVVRLESVTAELEREPRWRLRALRGEGLGVRPGGPRRLVEALTRWLSEEAESESAASREPSPVAASPSGGLVVPGRVLDDEPFGRLVWARLAPGARIEIEGGVVEDLAGVAVSDLDVSVQRLEDERLRTRGRGRPRGSGILEWNLAVDPSRGVADGPVRLQRVPLGVFEPWLPSLPLHEPQRTSVSSEVDLSTEGSVVRASGWLEVEDLALASPRIAAEPVRDIDVRFEGAARWDRGAHTLEVTHGSVVLRGVRAHVAGRAMLDGERYAISVRAALAPTGCDAAVHAIPAGLLGETAAIRFEGRLAASLDLDVRSDDLDATTLRIAVDDRCRFAFVPPPFDVARFSAPFRHEVVEPDGTVFSMETGPGSASWTPLLEVSPFVVHAVLAHEDAGFFTHAGFAPWAIRDALVRNLRERRYVLGASTITMQLAKNVFLRREKTLARKVQEVILTWWLERALTKSQILELYLNVIEYGPAVYGIRPAAQHYFGREPADLSVAEAAYLAMILPNPPRFHEHFAAGRVPRAFLRRTEQFVATMRARGRIDAEAEAQGREELAAFAFARPGERVGPEVLRGTSAPLPIEGWSGTPGLRSAGLETDERQAETWTEHEPEAGPDAWEEAWP